METFESKCFDIIGGNLVQHPSGYFTIDAKRKLDDLQPLYNERMHRKDSDDDALPIELAAYRSLIGKLLYIARLFSPVAVYYALAAATICAHLRLHHLRALNATPETTKGYAVTLSFQPSKDVKLQSEPCAKPL